MSADRLDLDALRTFVLACDLGGFARAADRREVTASAVSVQMKRLRTQVGAKLFRKEGRGVALTEAGELLLSRARRLLAAEDDLLETVRGAAASGPLRLGFSQDFVGGVLPQLLSRSAALFPRIRFEVEIAGHSRLVEAVTQGRLDLTLSLGRGDGPGASALGSVELLWIAGSEFAPRGGEPIPLVLLGPGCAMRAAAIEALDGAGTAWRVAATSPSLSGLWATALGGLGVTVRSRLGLPAGLVAERRLFGLPELGRVPIAIHASPHETRPPIARIRELMREALEPLLREAPPRTGERIGAGGHARSRPAARRRLSLRE